MAGVDPEKALSPSPAMTPLYLGTSDTRDRNGLSEVARAAEVNGMDPSIADAPNARRAPERAMRPNAIPPAPTPPNAGNENVVSIAYGIVELGPVMFAADHGIFAM
jgi:hypothetical protein